MDKEKNGLWKKAEKMYGIINGKTNLRVNKFQVIRGLWKGLAVPTIMYGLEVIDITGKEKKGLEVVQNKAARKALGANKHVAIEALRGEMGWSTFEERMEKTKINYRIRLEHMEEKRWAKRIFNWKGRNSKFKKQSNMCMNKIGMKITTSNNDKEIKLNGVVLDGERKIQGKVKKEVKKKGLNKWKENISKKRSLRWYKEKEIPKTENIFNGSWESTLLFKARTDSLEVNKKKKKWGGDNDKCEHCESLGRKQVETLEHLIIESEIYEEERKEFEEKILKIIRERK